MSITAAPGATFTALAEGLAPGLVGTITFGVRRVRPVPSTLALPEATTDIVEDPQDTDPPTSNYLATRVMPADALASGSTVEYQTAWPTDLVEEQETIVVEALGAVASIVPALADIGNLLSIIDDGNNYLTKWTADTTPTAAQVEAKAALAARDVTRDVGRVIAATEDNDTRRQLRDLAATRAAMYVTEKFSSQTTEDGTSVYPLLKRLYDEGVRALRRRGGAASVTLVSPYSGDDAVSSLDFTFPI